MQQTLASVEQLEVRRHNVKSTIRNDVTPNHPLNRKWLHLTHADLYPSWEKLFLQMLVEKYPHLVAKAINKHKNVGSLELEHVAFCWRLYMYCKNLPGCKAPASIVAMFI